MKKIMLTAGIIATVFFACKTGEKTTSSAPAKSSLNCSNTNYTYVVDIQPIMQQNCTRCHNTNMKAGYNFGEVADVKRAGSNGFLLGTIKYDVGFMHMPAYADKLDQATIDKIECWINTGMK